MDFLVLYYAYFEGCMVLLYRTQQVQAVLLLLGGPDVPTGVPTIEGPFNQNNMVSQNSKLFKAMLHLL